MSTLKMLKRAALCGLVALVCTTRSAPAWGQQRDSNREKELIALVSNAATPGADKALACKELALHGGPEAAQALAPLLADEQLASWARIALEAIPGPEAAAVLREASSKLSGRLLIGTLNSIGVRGDADSIEALSQRLNDADADVAGSAALALGRIGNEAAEKLLRAKLVGTTGGLKSAVAEACILVAERRLTSGQAGPAAEIYDEVRLAEVAKPRIIEATRGAILARTGDAVPLLMEQIASSDKAMQRLGLTVARELKNPQVAEALSSYLPKAQPEMAAMILIALADRGDKSALPAVMAIAKDGADSVRQAAAEALASLGDASSIPTLLTLAAQNNKDVSDAAMATLAGMRGEDVDRAILKQLDSASGPQQRLLVDLVGMRRMDAVAALRKAIDSNDQSVRHAALGALGQTIAVDQMNLLVDRLNSDRYAADLPVVQQALRAAAIRMDDREKVAGQLVASMSNLPTNVKTKLLEILAEVGGKTALQAMSTAFRSGDVALVDAASKLLGNWSTTEAADTLYQLSQSSPSLYTTRVIKGYIRLVRQFDMPEEQRVEMCRNAMRVAKTAPEQVLVVEVMERYPSLAMMDVAIAAQALPAVQSDLRRATLMIAAKLPESDEVKARLSKIGQAPVTVEIVSAQYGSADNKRDVADVLRKQLRNLPVIPLPAPSYNKAFGGDPAPNATKQLKIEYKLNGQAGQATFAENESIMLK